MKKNKKNTNLSELVYILDRSGSMSGMGGAAVEAFNQFVEEQQKVEGEAVLTQVLFDTTFDRPIDARRIEQVGPMEAADFRPGGCTALLDAIGSSIKATRKRIKEMPQEQQPATVVFAIFTDGLENSSQKYTWEKVAKKIKKRTEKDDWQFLFLAANQDAIATAAKMNIGRANSANLAYSKAGISSQGAGFSRRTSAYRRRSAGLVDKNHEDLVTNLSVISSQEQKKKEEAEKGSAGSGKKS